MRCMMLAITIFVTNCVAFASDVKGYEALPMEEPFLVRPAIDLSDTTSSRPSFVVPAASQATTEIANPFDILGAPSLGQPPIGNSQTPVGFSPAIQGQEVISADGYRPLHAMGPAGIPSILQYMTCDPHSCPNIWQGYEAQRQAELARKCTPRCSGCCSVGCGCSAGSRGLYGAPCMNGTSCAKKPLNRYRTGAASGCNSCDKASCDGNCAASQVGLVPQPESETKLLSKFPTPELAR
ncbi:MAG: hypothetical protein SGI77_18335 [Pirellulaceae bacterium]|nr:hypothetical protein [Pirellulaceae bacterium]